MSANDGYPKPGFLDYFQWAFVFNLYTEKGLRERAQNAKGTPYSKFLLEVADARRDKRLNGVNAMKIVHEAQKRVGAR